MNHRNLLRALAFGIAVVVLDIAPALSAPEPVSLTVRADQPGAAISPTFSGIFFEDINFGGDGGLYPERVKNGSFEFSPDEMMGWRKVERSGGSGSLGLLNDRSLNANNPHYLRLTAIDAGNAGAAFGLTNEGFRGMGIVAGGKFTFSAYARSASTEAVTLAIELQDRRGRKIASAELSGFTPEWKQHTVEIECPTGDDRGTLAVLARTAGSVDLDMISLFPQDTWQNRPRGLRRDLVQLLKDMSPKFMRFPGGCIVEGRFLNTRYDWKQTIGDPAQRRLIVNRWNTEFKRRQTPDYFQSFGLGYFEFFQLCEDIGAKPVPIVNCGMACQYNSCELVPLNELGPYIQDVLDLIEFANGPADSTWGRKRAEMGHPAPFNLDRLGVGNEQWGPRYIERYERFATAIKAKYPQIKLISAAGPGPDGREFTYAWKRLTELNTDIIDEHYYRKPEWFLANTNRYDKYDRNGPKVFAGEFAAQSVAIASPDNRNDWQCALAEAAFMTGLERNGDLVVMTSYAPLLAHVEAWQWTPNLIWFDNLRSYGTPSYYVQKLFGANTGTMVLPVEITGSVAEMFVVASREEASGDIILKIVNAGVAARTAQVDLRGVGAANITADAQVLASDDLKAENSLDQPTKVAPVAATWGSVGPKFQREIAPRSLTVVRLRASK